MGMRNRKRQIINETRRILSSAPCLFLGARGSGTHHEWLRLGNMIGMGIKINMTIGMITRSKQ